jgi:hypothetical protein
MSSHDDPFPRRGTGAHMAIAIAEGVLVERYRISAELARALLQTRATRAACPWEMPRTG